jgi:acid phosphatase
MRNAILARPFFMCAICLTIGWLVGSSGIAALWADPAAATGQTPVFPMTARIGANIYLQTAAEYRACCSTIYKCAELRLQTILESSRPRAEMPAVVMDLDETVLDNSAFQTFLYKNNLEYTSDLWDDYEQNYPQDVSLIPDVKHFIDRAEELGVTIVFISNRSELHRASTKSALDRLGINTSGPLVQLYMRPKDGNSDKSARRERAAAKYNVLMYFGDNLRDFSESFKAASLPMNPTPDDCLKAIRQRQASTDDALCHWGLDWFAIPNPVYGEWESLIGPNPLAIMHPTTMKMKTPRAISSR